MNAGSSHKLALEAVRQALKVRQQVNADLVAPICIYDVIEHLGVNLWFKDIPSMEAMYCKGTPATIVVSSLRPTGRQVFNAAHELGHHMFGHGTHIDQLMEQDQAAHAPEEYLANMFAGGLLMPKTAVNQAFTVRGWQPATSTPRQVFTIAGWFGVGYTTLLQHMAYTLQLITPAHAKNLERISPKHIRAEILGLETSADLVVVDSHWNSARKAIDIQVDDLIYLPPQIINAKIGDQHCVERVAENEHYTVLKGRRAGIGQLTHPNSGWSAFVRVSKRGFTGRSIYRHLEDPDDE